MVTDLKTTIGYKCANCNRNNYKDISVFDLNMKQSVNLNCACGAHLGEIKCKNRDSYVIYASCCYCSEKHSFYIKKKNLWHDHSMAYECPATSLAYIAVGDEDEVHKEMHKAEDDFDELLSSMQDMDEDSTIEEAIMQILEKIQHMDSLGKLYCTCGNNELFVDILDSEVILMCGECGQSMTIDASNEEELNAFINLEEIALKGLK